MQQAVLVHLTANALAATVWVESARNAQATLVLRVIFVGR